MQIKKPQRKNVKLSGSQELVILTPFVLLIGFILVVICLAMAYRLTTAKKTDLPKSLTYAEYNQGKQYPITNWNTYTNEQYGITIKYPAEGYIQEPGCFDGGSCKKVILGACGNGIKVSPWTKSSTFIQLDNMMGIIVNNYNGSIDNFITSQGGDAKSYTVIPMKSDNPYVNVKGSDDAVLIGPAKAQENYVPPVPSIVAPSYIVKKGDYIFQIAPLQNSGSKTGCLPPAGTKSSSFQSAFWNIPHSISFQ
ncbi:MAG TPA: hypothetical protein VG917_01665 [Patescibacteria group bacterium]|nr:hypothetical protein [Patescibacteria group bacterium]